MSADLSGDALVAEAERLDPRIKLEPHDPRCAVFSHAPCSCLVAALKAAQDERDQWAFQCGDANAGEDIAIRERDVLAEKLAAACIDYYEHDRHYDHDGDHLLASWSEVVQLRARVGVLERQVEAVRAFCADDFVVNVDEDGWTEKLEIYIYPRQIRGLLNKSAAQERSGSAIAGFAVDEGVDCPVLGAVQEPEEGHEHIYGDTADEILCAGCESDPRHVENRGRSDD